MKAFYETPGIYETKLTCLLWIEKIKEKTELKTPFTWISKTCKCLIGLLKIFYVNIDSGEKHCPLFTLFLIWMTPSPLKEFWMRLKLQAGTLSNEILLGGLILNNSKYILFKTPSKRINSFQALRITRFYLNLFQSSKF